MVIFCYCFLFKLINFRGIFMNNTKKLLLPFIIVSLTAQAMYNPAQDSIRERNRFRRTLAITAVGVSAYLAPILWSAYSIYRHCSQDDGYNAGYNEVDCEYAISQMQLLGSAAATIGGACFGYSLLRKFWRDNYDNAIEPELEDPSFEEETSNNV